MSQPEQVYLSQIAGLEAEIERLRAALKLIDDYYQSGGDLKSHMAHIAQDALGISEQ